MTFIEVCKHTGERRYLSAEEILSRLKALKLSADHIKTLVYDRLPIETGHYWFRQQKEAK